MHETVIASKIITSLKRKGEIKSVTIEVGELAPITGEELRKAIKTICSWEVVIKNKEAKISCKCGYEGKPKIIQRKHGLVLFVCPKCSIIPKVIEGDNIIIKEVEVK